MIIKDESWHLHNESGPVKIITFELESDVAVISIEGERSVIMGRDDLTAEEFERQVRDELQAWVSQEMAMAGASYLSVNDQEVMN